MKRPWILPELFWVEVCESHYHKAYRYLNEWDGEPCRLISRYRERLPGKTIWVMLDSSNGFYFQPQGKIYIWMFNTKKQALSHYTKQNSNKHNARLRYPIKCTIVEEVSLP